MSEGIAESLAVVAAALVPDRDVGEVAPGSGRVAIAEAFSEVGVSSNLAGEASAFFGWYERIVELQGPHRSDGLQVMPGYWGMSLSESLAHRREELEINLDVLPDDEVDPLVWEPGWLPLLRSGGGTYYVESMAAPRAGGVYYVSIAEVAVVKLSASLPNFLHTLATAYRTGVFSPGDAGSWECDVDRWAPLLEGLNPGCGWGAGERG